MEKSEYCYDWLGGPVFRRLAPESTDTAGVLAKAHRSYVVEVLVDDPAGGGREMRRYFALNLLQAVARANELQVRLREMGLEPTLTDIRRTTDLEVDDFFRVINHLELRMPDPISSDRNQQHLSNG